MKFIQEEDIKNFLTELVLNNSIITDKLGLIIQQFAWDKKQKEIDFNLNTLIKIFGIENIAFAIQEFYLIKFEALIVYKNINENKRPIHIEYSV